MRYASVLLTLLVCLWSPGAVAQEQPSEDEGSERQTSAAAPYSFGSEPGWHLLGGLSAGGGFGTLGAGGFAGLELSLSQLQRGVWWGGYIDATYDFAQRGAMATIGPQFGYAVVGLDGGFAARIDTGDDPGAFDYGPQGRLLVTLGLFGIYGRYVYLLEGQEHLGQAGILLKLPLWAN